MNIPVLITGTIIIIVFSWFFSIREKRYHGIARFFGFESIFILCMLNIDIWFRDAFSWHQVISWILLFICIYPAIAGFLLLKRQGMSQKSFENTTVLVNTGIYRYIRHPLYCSLILLGTGVMFKDPGPFQIVCGIINLIAMTITALIEEKEMLARFGPEYTDYMKKTKMFIPFIV